MNHLSQFFNHSVYNYGYRPLFWVTPTTYTTYSDLAKKVLCFKDFLIAKGIGRQDNIVLIGDNSDDFMAVCQAGWSLGAVIIPMYEKQNPDVKNHIIAQTKPKIIFNSGPILKDMPCEQINHTTQTFEHIPNNANLTETSKDDVAVIIYTSGTTGLPKGVVLSHYNIISNMKSADFRTQDLPVTVNDKYVSFLPWSHVYGLTCEILYLMWKGASTHLANIKELKEEFPRYNPTIICTVPKLLSEISKNVAVAWLSWKYLSPIAYFVDLRTKMFGTNLRHIACGGSNITKKTLKLFKNLGIEIYQGYGITECAPLISLNSLDNRMGSVGKILDCNTVKLDESTGEILVTGTNVSSGYYLDPVATSESFVPIDDKVYFKTGDQGVIDEDGYLYITARLKETFKLENGKFCNPVTVESVITEHPDIKFAMVYANPGDEYTRLIVSTKLSESEVRAEVAKMKIDKFLMPKQITVTPELFTVDNNLVTPKQSLRRKEILKRYNLLPTN
jgi:long-chain acyl-CoA synthetase